MQATKTRKLNLKRPLFTSAIVAVVGLAVTYIVSQSIRMDRLHESQIEARKQTISSYINDQIKKSEDIMGASLLAISEEPNLQQAFLAKDRVKLNALAAPIYATLNSNYGISHLYFMTPAGQIFLRAHRPAVNGDMNKRRSLAQAMATGLISSDTEVGTMGMLTTRVVVPWKNGDELLGYLELGIDVKTIMQKIEGTFGSESSLLLFKRDLSRASWERYHQAENSSVKWDMFHEFVLVTENNSISTEVSAALHKLEHSSFTDQIKVQSGADAELRLFTTPIQGKAGNTVGLISLIVDFTAERRLASRETLVVSLITVLIGGILLLIINLHLGKVEKQLAATEKARRNESDKLHRFFLDNIDIGAFLIEDATITDVSTLGADMFGYSRDELVGQSPAFVVSARSKENVQRRVQEGNKVAYESEGQRKDGTTFPMQVKGRELVFDGRDVRLTTIIDLSERKDAEVTLRKLSRAVDQNPSAVFITDTTGKIEYVNAKFVEYLGFSAEEAIGQNPRILSSGNTSKDVYADLWGTIRSGQVWRHELEDKRKDGTTFWAHATIAPVKDDEDVITHFIATHDDISRRKEAERTAQLALEQANVANRAKTDLLANMSHELRTPLNAIIGFSSTIMEETFGPVGNAKYQEYLADINQSGTHLLALINDILDVSAIESEAMELREEKVCVTEIVETSIRILGPRAIEGQVKVWSDICEEIPRIFADERRVKQVILNLLSNAVKFTHKGGEVSVSSWLQDDGTLGVCVSDTGIGMTKDEIKKAMTAFGQVDSGLDRMHEGTGLGLPLTQGLMEMHGGSLKVRSEKGKGTQVTVTFPTERILEDVC